MLQALGGRGVKRLQEAPVAFYTFTNSFTST